MPQDELIKQLSDLVAEQKTANAKFNEELKNMGGVNPETKSALDAIAVRLDKIQQQADAIDAANQERHAPGGHEQLKSLGQLITEDAEFLKRVNAAGGIKGHHPINLVFDGTGAFDTRKSVITTGGVSTATTGVQPLQRLFNSPLPLAQQELRVRDLLTVKKMTTGNAFDYPLQNLRTNAASPQVEAAAKAESTYGWTSVSGRIRTIAHYTNVTVQSLDDIPWMRSTIDNQLMYGLLLQEEMELLAGSGVGEHLQGLITAATAYATGTYNVAGDTKIDKVRHAKLQCRIAGLGTFPPDGIVLNPRDMHDMELIKSNEGTVANNGLYVIGDPKTGPAVKMLWGLPVVESDSITYGTFLVGAFGTAATLMDRMVATVDISFEHDVNFTKNLATIRAEERIGLAIQVPTAFVSGTFA